MGETLLGNVQGFVFPITINKTIYQMAFYDFGAVLVSTRSTLLQVHRCVYKDAPNRHGA